ncbi:3-oxoacyl-[acyl-carrier-protein] synthase II [Kibdelosporangium phytohabitans]|nr:3-oxoacyl-[acyl-carrier-protein] synthase II [Kibdelosporangium phytohabitans]
MRTDVWATGLGAMTPLGGDVGTTWSAMLAGANGIQSLTEPWARDLPVRMAARLTSDPADALPRAFARRLDRGEQLAIVTARQAWADAGSPEVDPDRLAVVIGTGVGGVLSTLGQNHVLETLGPRKVSPTPCRC